MSSDSKNAMYPNLVRALSVIIQDTTSELTDAQRVMFLLKCANAEYRNSDNIDADLMDMQMKAERDSMEHYNYER